jgi:hypothetical protein
MQRTIAVLVVSVLGVVAWLSIVPNLSIGATVWSVYLSRVGAPFFLLAGGWAMKG